MDLALIFKIGIAGVMVSILYSILKQAGRDEYAYVTVLGGLVIILALVVQLINDLFTMVKTVFNLY
ncbi:MAG: stage III sporulation protein AC [Firmicutes bacterium]|nr:stage III sporulation protein AC [Bacillota bacterium]